MDQPVVFAASREAAEEGVLEARQLVAAHRLDQASLSV
jgi:hypothetical protein